MKTLFKAGIFLGIFIFLIACRLSSQSMPFSVSAATATLAPNHMLTPAMATPTAVEPTAPVVSSPTLWPTNLPTIAPELIPDLLNSSLIVQTLDSTNGHNLRKVTGWKYGFRPSYYCFGPYQWIDQSHLLLFPLVGQEDGMGTNQLSLPTVINIENGNIWIPTKDNLLSLSGCDQVLWSQALNLIIAPQSSDTIVFSSQGDIMGRYPGTNISLSPSGTKLMVGSLWVDLLSGKKVDFSPQGVEPFSAWSADETRLYRCCHMIWNATTGKAETLDSGALSALGRGYGAGSIPAGSLWVMNDAYIVSYLSFENNIFPLVEPSTLTYIDLPDVTDIPDDIHCALGSVTPDRQQIWLNCGPPDNYLFDLATFTTHSYPNNYHLTAWSSNSRFARVADLNADGTQYILSVQDLKIQPLPVQAWTGTIVWHPSDSVLTYLSARKQTLVLLEASTMSVREFTLPQPFRDIVWKPNGEGLVLLAEDGSLWQVDYPNLENLEPLTPALPEVRDLLWSPDGTSIAFVSGTDIYIVEVTKK
jgi:hypothetical protein